MMINFQQQVNRAEPKMAPSAYKTYAIRSPHSTHTRVVRCDEVMCDHWRNGWKTVLDVSNPAHREAATWITNHGARRFTMERAGNIVTFTFPAGQWCFQEHRVAIRPATYLVQPRGDWRTPRERKHVVSEQDWVDDFGEHQERLAAEQQRG